MHYLRWQLQLLLLLLLLLLLGVTPVLANGALLDYVLAV
jgi:hypothetical protein